MITAKQQSIRPHLSSESESQEDTCAVLKISTSCSVILERNAVMTGAAVLGCFCVKWISVFYCTEVCANGLNQCVSNSVKWYPFKDVLYLTQKFA